MLNQGHPDRHSAASATCYNMLDIGTSTGILVLGTVAGEIGFTRMFVWITVIMGVFLLLAAMQYRSKDDANLRLEELQDIE